MKKQVKRQTKLTIPSFATADDEAKWWYENRNVHGMELLGAVTSGQAQVLTKAKLLERITASKRAPAPVVALRIPAPDLALARKQAEQKGLPYQTYIKSLLHEALVAHERRKVR
jgi:predicted DNA binding CopG/RHH family protein